MDSRITALLILVENHKNLRHGFSVDQKFFKLSLHSFSFSHHDSSQYLGIVFNFFFTMKNPETHHRTHVVVKQLPIQSFRNQFLSWPLEIETVKSEFYLQYLTSVLLKLLWETIKRTNFHLYGKLEIFEKNKSTWYIMNFVITPKITLKSVQLKVHSVVKFSIEW